MKQLIASTLVCLLAAAEPTLAQQPAPPSQAPPPAATPTSADATPLSAIAKPRPRVFVTDSDSWQVAGGSGGSGSGFGGGFSGGARPQTAEVIKTLGQRCPEIIVNSHPDASDYILRLDHEGGKGYLRHKDKVVVFDRRSGDSIFSKSTLSVGGAVQDSCGAITNDWATRAHNAADSATTPMPVAVPPSTAPIAAAPTSVANLSIDSSVPAADIEIDGNFVGSTPSTVAVTPGQHTILVKKKGYADWTRTMTIAGPSIHLNADLEQAPAAK